MLPTLLPKPRGSRIVPRVCALLLVLPLLAARPAGHATKPDPWEGALQLEALLDSLAKAHGVPALAAAVVERGRVVAIGAAGVTVAGGGRAVRADDPFHIGSCTKSMTALAIARLVEKHKLEWSTTLGEVFDETLADMLPVYRHVRLDQLLTHRGQIPAYEHVGDDTLIALNEMGGGAGAIATRVAFLRYLVELAPQHNPSEPYDYSNAGYTLAAAMAERVTGKTWDRLVRELVFEPLAMTHAGFGWPADAPHHDGPRGHRCGDSTGVEPEPLKTTYQLGAILGPGGDVNASIADLARFLAFQLDGATGRATNPPLAPATWKRLHDDPDGAMPGYAMGWQVLPGDSSKPMLFHDGTAGTFYARMLVQPARDRAVVIVCNAGPLCGRAACEQGLAAVLAWVGARLQ
jgi:CubicO group peptidase (beta-lactamase class C family)